MNRRQVARAAWPLTAILAFAAPLEARQRHVVDPPTPPSHLEVFDQVLPDLWRFISWDTAMVLGLGGEAALVAHSFDDHFKQEVATNAQFNASLQPGSKYGAFAYTLSGSYALYAVGLLSHQTHMTVAGADLVRAQIVSQLWVQAVKFTVQRERPDGSNSVSFPSGHSAAGFALASTLSRHYGWKAGVPAYAGAAYIGFSRIHDNKHYLSDVVFGAAMGVAGARTVMLSRGRYGAVIAPTPVPKGLAVMVSLRPAARH